ncbi:MAG: hypothetical protein H6Q05_3939 [Acidobacteria bacterium]|jgi:hypothetical protein|nr:hypothetical protein [Acidobacteriota bacterium]
MGFLPPEENAFAQGALEEWVACFEPRSDLCFSQREYISGIRGGVLEEICDPLGNGFLRLLEYDKEIQVASSAVVLASEGAEQQDSERLRMLRADAARRFPREG